MTEPIASHKALVEALTSIYTCGFEGDARDAIAHVLREAPTIHWVRISTHGYPEHRRRLLILTDDKKEDAALGWFQGFYRDQPEWQIKPVSWLPFKPAYWAYLEFPK